MRMLIRTSSAHVVFLVSWDVLRLMWDGSPISYSTLTFIHMDACIPCYMFHLFFLLRQFWSSLFSAICSPACFLQVPYPLLPFGVFTNVELYCIWGETRVLSHPQPQNVTHLLCATRLESRLALGVVYPLTHVIVF